jgi:hypothetical protein
MSSVIDDFEFDNRQQAIFDVLQSSNNPKLAGVYKQVLITLSKPAVSGCEQARISAICHLMRELMNRLAEAMTGKDIPSPKPNSGAITKKIASMSLDSINVDNASDDSLVPISGKLARKVASLQKARKQEDNRNRRLASMFLTGTDTDQVSPIVREWQQVHRFFFQAVHLDNGGDHQLPTDKELIEKIQVVEEYIEIKGRPFFDNKNKVQELLAEINQIVGTSDSYQVPSDETVKEVLRQIAHPQLQRIFYHSLKNPEWFHALKQNHVFENPPEPIGDENDEQVMLSWPQLDYLVRVASQYPIEIVDLFLSYKQTKNIYVQMAVFSIGIAIPPAKAALLRPLLVTWEQPSGGWQAMPTAIAKFAIYLLKSKSKKACCCGLFIADELFVPRESARGYSAHAAIDDYYYEELLPQIVDVLGNSELKTVLRWLQKYEELAGKFASTKGYDFTEKFRSPDTRSLYRVETSLIDAVQKLATKRMNENPQDVVKILTEDCQMELARAICYSSLAQALDGDVINSCQESQLLGIAHQLLFDTENFSKARSVEYGNLAQAAARHSRKLLEGISAFIKQGLINRLRENDDETDEVVYREHQEDIDRLDYYWLQAIGVDVLPDDGKEILKKLDEEFKDVESGVQKKRPQLATVEQMKFMQPQELVDYLVHWHKESDDWGLRNTVVSLAQNLRKVIEANPQAISGIDNLVEVFRPAYLGELLLGWTIAISQGKELDWQYVVSIIRDTLKHDDQSQFPVMDVYEDKNYREAKQLAVDLLVKAMRFRGGSVISSELFHDIDDLLVNGADDELAWEVYDQNAQLGDQTGPLELTQGWQWSLRVEGLLNIISQPDKTDWCKQALSAFEKEAQRSDEHGALAALVGANLENLLYGNSDWITPNIARFFGTSDSISVSQQTAFTTAVTFHQYIPQIYDLLSPSMIAALNLSGPIAHGSGNFIDPLSRIGEWALIAVMEGNKTEDDLVFKTFYEKTVPEVRGSAMRDLVGSFKNNDSVPKSVLDYAAKLWDKRMDHVRQFPEDCAELDGFDSFVLCGKYPSSWWLPKFVEVVDLYPPIVESTKYQCESEIVAAAEDNPAEALELIMKMLLNDDVKLRPMTEYSLMRRLAPSVIASAMLNGDEGLRSKANKVMNDLGSRISSAIDLEDQVDDIITSRNIDLNVASDC